MNTFNYCLSGNSFRKAIASLALVATLISGQSAFAQNVTLASNKTMQENTGNMFHASAYPLENSVSVKVHFVNPEKEKVTVAIYSQSEELVFKKIVGRTAIFHGKFDLANLPDGIYTIVVSGKKESYSRSISIRTQQERFALVN